MPSSDPLHPDTLNRRQGTGYEVHYFANLFNERQHDVHIVYIVRFENRHKGNRALRSCTRDGVFPVADEEFKPHRHFVWTVDQ